MKILNLSLLQKIIQAANLEPKYHKLHPGPQIAYLALLYRSAELGCPESFEFSEKDQAEYMDAILAVLTMGRL